MTGSRLAPVCLVFCFLFALGVGFFPTSVVGAGLVPALSAEIPFGTLEIQTEPDTTILWDHHSLGTINNSGRMVISQIPLGPYTLSLRKEGFSDWTDQIEILAGSQSLMIELVPVPRFSPELVGEGLAPSQPAVASVEDVGEGLAPSLPGIEQQPVDPLARGTGSVGLVTFMLILALIAVGAYGLGRRQSREPKPEAEPTRPHLIAEQPERWTRAQPTFYDDIRERESALDGFREAVRESPNIKIVDIDPPQEPEPEESA